MSGPAPDGAHLLGCRFFAHEDPIGERIAYDREPAPQSTWYEIVGVVGDQHQESPGQLPAPEVFESRSQDWGRTVWLMRRSRMAALTCLARPLTGAVPQGRRQPVCESRADARAEWARGRVYGRIAQ